MATPARTYRCLYNHEMLICFTTQSPYQTYREDVTRRQFEGYVRELSGTQVDALLCCPTAWRLPLYPSAVDPRWTTAATTEAEPPAEADRRYYDKVYWRVRRTMLTGVDPLAITLATAREVGLGCFLSYRMNDHHYLNRPDCPTHPRFWREHPELRIAPAAGNHHLDYLRPEVRDWYARILQELLDRYDVDGLELDFMRGPTYFAANRVAEGMPVMTAFVRDLRRRLDEVGRQRGRRLLLGVRVQRNLALCESTGLDVRTWDREGLVDMVNASPFYLHSADVDIEGLKRELHRARVYGEMHFITRPGRTPGGFANNIHRYTTPTQYETCALSFLDRGADGVSLFNFAYTRDHHFGEPRRREYPGWEPPWAVLGHIADEGYLRSRPKHYHKIPVYPADPGDKGALPMTIGAGRTGGTRLYIADRLEPGHPFARALLRLESDVPIVGIPVQVAVNGKALTPTHGLGELFAPFAPEAIPHYENLLFFEVPLGSLTHGWNELSIRHPGAGAYESQALCLAAIELALYTRT